MPSLPPANPLFLALDVADCNRALQIAQRLAPHLGGIKLGMEFFYSCGMDACRRIRALGLPLLLDLKLHDIPATVAAGIRALTQNLAPDMLTIHASGGTNMMCAALDAARESAGGTRIVAVTLLTSLEQQDLTREAIPQSPAERTAHLAASAIAAGIDALVCSPLDIASLRQKHAKDILFITPGLRPEGARQNDQKRSLSPRQALDAGADILVIGRPILQAEDPLAAAGAIQRSLGI